MIKKIKANIDWISIVLVLGILTIASLGLFSHVIREEIKSIVSEYIKE